uniref:Uncharacterized protein n=1 Tax=Octopus bimaculoides TaxID=37653 RepID=A0A0L8IGS7_OCTBM
MMPPNSLQAIFGGALEGIWDSLRGTIKFYKIFVESSQKEKEMKKKNTKPLIDEEHFNLLLLEWRCLYGQQYIRF